MFAIAFHHTHSKLPRSCCSYCESHRTTPYHTISVGCSWSVPSYFVAETSSGPSSSSQCSSCFCRSGTSHCVGLFSPTLSVTFVGWICLNGSVSLHDIRRLLKHTWVEVIAIMHSSTVGYRITCLELSQAMMRYRHGVRSLFWLTCTVVVCGVMSEPSRCLPRHVSPNTPPWYVPPFAFF